MKLIPKLLFSIIFVLGVLPVLFMFISSIIDEGGKISLVNYSYLFRNDGKVNLLFNSLLIGFLTVLFTLFIGIPVSFLLARTRIAFNNIFLILFLSPAVVPPYIYAVACTNLFNKNGLLNTLFGIGSVTGWLMDSIYGTVFVLTLAFMPITVLFLINGLKNTDRSIEEAAVLDMDKASLFLKVTLPLIMPSILSGSILVFILSISEFSVPMFLGVNTFTTEIFTQFAAFYNYGSAVALSFPLITIILVVMVFEYKVLKDVSFSPSGPGFTPVRAAELKKWELPAIIFLSFILLITVFLPLAATFVRSLSFEAYDKAFSSSEKGIVISIVNALTGAVILTTLSFINAYFVEREKKLYLDFIPLCLFAMPGVILGIGLIQLWNRGPLSYYVYDSFLLVQIGYVSKYLIIPTRLFTNAFRQLPVAFEEAAIIDGASIPQLLRKIILPVLKPAFLISFILTFIFCFGELAITILVYPAGGATLPIRLFTIMTNSRESVISAMSIILLLPILFVLIPAIVLMTKNEST